MQTYYLESFLALSALSPKICNVRRLAGYVVDAYALWELYSRTGVMRYL